jgi:hypothetical protein
MFAQGSIALQCSLVFVKADEAIFVILAERRGPCQGLFAKEGAFDMRPLPHRLHLSDESVSMLLRDIGFEFEKD